MSKVLVPLLTLLLISSTALANTRQCTVTAHLRKPDLSRRGGQGANFDVSVKNVSALLRQPNAITRYFSDTPAEYLSGQFDNLQVVLVDKNTGQQRTFPLRPHFLYEKKTHSLKYQDYPNRITFFFEALTGESFNSADGSTEKKSPPPNVSETGINGTYDFSRPDFSLEDAVEASRRISARYASKNYFEEISVLVTYDRGYLTQVTFSHGWSTTEYVTGLGVTRSIPSNYFGFRDTPMNCNQ